MSAATDAPATAGEFRAVAALADLVIDAPTPITLGDRSICVMRLHDGVIAFEDSCPHRGHPLSEGRCVDGVLRCALHGWEFSIPQGDAVSPRAPFGLDFLPTRVVDGSVEVGS
jgi:nitrite reductase/ring-hydroxylating ferredoxin subunit